MHWSPAVRVCMVIIKSTKGFFIPEVPGANCSTFQYAAHTATVLVCLKSAFGFFFLCVGHEYPYGIKMSHLRDTALLAQGSKDSPTPSNLQEPFLTEQLPREMQCQFILKPSRLAVTQQLSGEFSPPSYSLFLPKLFVPESKKSSLPFSQTKYFFLLNLQSVLKERWSFRRQF